MHILGPLLHNRRQYVGSQDMRMHAALHDLRELVLAIPLPWQASGLSRSSAPPAAIGGGRGDGCANGCG
jgi:hypothetical protein